MKRHVIILTRILLMTGSLLLVFFLFRLTLAGEQALTVFQTVYANCIVILVSLLYYCVIKCFYHACYPPKRGRRRVLLVQRDQLSSNYLDLQQVSSTTDVILGVPRLTIQNVWTLVYGVGFILFVSSYCMLSLHPFCLACVGLAMSILAVDELVCPRRVLNKLYISARSSALLTVIVSLVLVTFDLINSVLVSFVATLDLYSIVFGLCLPFASQFLMITVRDNRRYSLGSVVEVCEFGLPFTAFLGVFHLSVAYGQRFQMISDERPSSGNQTSALHGPEIVALLVQTNGPFVLFYSLAPLFVGPAVMGYVSCVLDGSAIDPLLSVSLTLCIQYLVLCTTSTLGIYGTVCCLVAIAIRVLADYTPALGEYPGQCGDSQLTADVLRNTAP
jgi:hypothetical protein